MSKDVLGEVPLRITISEDVDHFNPFIVDIAIEDAYMCSSGFAAVFDLPIDAQNVRAVFTKRARKNSVFLERESYNCGECNQRALDDQIIVWSTKNCERADHLWNFFTEDAPQVCKLLAKNGNKAFVHIEYE